MKRAIPAVVVLLLALAIWFFWFRGAASSPEGSSGGEVAGSDGAGRVAQRSDGGASQAPEATARSSSSTTRSLGTTDSGADTTVSTRGDAGTEQFRRDVEAWMKKNAAEAEKEIDRFCDENKKVKSAHLFPDAGGTRDAAIFMLNRIDWEDDVRPKGTLHLPEPLRKHIRTAGADWPTALSADDLAGLDFSWLRELQQYDTWSVASFGPLRDDRPLAFASSPIPNYVSLMEWAKLRFVRAFVDGDLASADAEVRHLAALIESQGIVIADAIAVAVMRIDAQARAAAVAAGRDFGSWAQVDDGEAASYRRVSLSGPYFFAPGVSEAVVKKAHGCLANPCSALAEGLGMQLSFAPYSDGSTRALVEGYAQQSGCSQSLLDRVRQSPPMEAAGTFDVSTSVESYFSK
ncbi:MAG: hypothetical protein QM723_27805 [Myxococcaceae bacterium]